MGTALPWPDGSILPFSAAIGRRPNRSARDFSATAIEAVVFDLGGVLYDDTVWQRWLLRLLRQLGLHTNYRSFFRVWDREFLEPVHRGEGSFGEAFRRFLACVGLQAPQIEEVEAACRARRRSVEDELRPLPSVKSTLHRLLQSGRTLAVLANSEHHGEVLATRLDRIGLGGIFSLILSSRDLQQTVPHPQCFQTLAARLDRTPRQLAYVGHDAQELAGARRAGLATLAFNFDPDAEADVFLARFDHLAELLPPVQALAAAG